MLEPRNLVPEVTPRELNPSCYGFATEFVCHVWNLAHTVVALIVGEVSSALVPARDGILVITGGACGVSLLCSLGNQRIIEGLEVLGVNTSWVLKFLVCTALVDQVCIVSSCCNKRKEANGCEEKNTEKKEKDSWGDQTHVGDVKLVHTMDGFSYEVLDGGGDREFLENDF